MKFILFYFILISIHVIYGSVTLDVDSNNGDFEVVVANSVWFKGDEIFVKSNGNKYSNLEPSDSNLKLIVTKSNHFVGIDKVLGEFKETSLLFESIDGHASIECTYKLFETAIIFSQNIPFSIYNASYENDQDTILTSFPTFDLKDNSNQLGYAHWVSWHYEDSDSGSDSRSGSNSNSKSKSKRNIDNTNVNLTNSDNVKQHRELLVAPGFITPTYGLFQWSTEKSV